MSDKITIDKGIPLQPRFRGMRPKPDDPRRVALEQMEVGDSAYFARSLDALKIFARREGVRLGRKYEVRRVGDGMRMWRTK